MTLLNYNYKKYSTFLILLGLVVLYLYLQGVRPIWLDIKTFAIVSTYMESRYFQFISTNLMDELALILLCTGIYLLVFTKEKNEISAFQTLRLKAFMWALKSSLICFLILYLLFYGYIIFAATTGIIIFFIMSYYLYFRYLIIKK